VGPCHIIATWSSSGPFGIPPKTPTKLSDNIFGIVVRNTRHVSCSLYKNIDISFLATPSKEQSPSSSLNFEVNAFRMEQAFL